VHRLCNTDHELRVTASKKRVQALCLTYKNVYQFTCTEQEVPYNRDVHESFQYCTVVLIMSPFWFLDLWKICVPLYWTI